jgi:hypothetical protein
MRRDRASERRSNGAVVSDAVRAHSPLLKGVGRSGAGWGITSTPLPLGLVRPDHDRQARRSYATAVNEMLAVGRRSHYRH